MDIIKYDIVNPVIDRNKPFYSQKYHNLVIRDNNIKHKYYIECSLINKETGAKEYYLLLSYDKISSNSRKISIDPYCRRLFKLSPEIEAFVQKETAERGNIEFNYIESTEDYDVFMIE